MAEQEVVGLVLLDVEVGVAGDPEQVGLDDLHAREQRVQVGGDHLLQRDVERSASTSTRRGRIGGTLTRAKRCSPVTGSRHRHARARG